MGKLDHLDSLYFNSYKIWLYFPPKTIPDSSREVSEIDEFIDKAKQNVNTETFIINITEKPLYEVTDFLEIFVPEVKVPDSVHSKSIALQIGKKTVKEIVSDLGVRNCWNKQIKLFPY
jgi:hypothetical protein